MSNPQAGEPAPPDRGRGDRPGAPGPRCGRLGRRRRLMWLLAGALLLPLVTVVVLFPFCTRAPMVAPAVVTQTASAAPAVADGNLTVMTLNLAHGRKLAGVLLLPLVTALVMFPFCTRSPMVAPAVVTQTASAAPAVAEGELTVMTLNLAHGRKLAKAQGFQGRRRITANLDDIAAVLRREAPDVVAVQEADGNSWWNGRFNHPAYIATAAGYGQCAWGAHVKGWGLAYGTGLLARMPLADAQAHTFHRRRPYFAKGFTVARVPLTATQDVTVVAVHLDFSSARIRASEVEELVAVLRARQAGPLIVLGDFNAQWLDERSAVREVATALGLVTWQPAARDLVTFAPFGSRLDYILISPELEVVRHQVLLDAVSDHRPVLATVRLKRG